MQITEEVQAEVMEILADDQMKHAEAPSDAEMEAMHSAFIPSEEEHDWVKEARLEEIRVHEMLRPIPHRSKWNGNNYPGQELDEHIRANAEAAHTDSHRYDEQNY